MLINHPNPLEIPATPARVFPHVWLYSVIASVPSMDTGSIRIETLPCNMETGEIAPGDYMTPLSTDRLWDAVKEVPEVAAAMAAILAAVGPLHAWIEAQNSTAPTE